MFHIFFYIIHIIRARALFTGHKRRGNTDKKYVKANMIYWTLIFLIKNSNTLYVMGDLL